MPLLTITEPGDFDDALVALTAECDQLLAEFRADGVGVSLDFTSAWVEAIIRHLFDANEIRRMDAEIMRAAIDSLRNGKPELLAQRDQAMAEQRMALLTQGVQPPPIPPGMVPPNGRG